MIYWLHMPHFVWWLKLKEIDCLSESIQFDVRSMTDALISVFIGGLLMVLLLHCTQSINFTILLQSGELWRLIKYITRIINIFSLSHHCLPFVKIHRAMSKNVFPLYTILNNKFTDVIKDRLTITPPPEEIKMQFLDLNWTSYGRGSSPSG